MKKELKEQIKQDEFTSGLEQAVALGRRAPGRGADRGRGRRRPAGRGGGASSTSRASGRARRTGRSATRSTAFEAPVAAELAPGAERPSGQVFATAEDKYKTAAAAFEGVERRFGSSHRTGLRAKYFAALSRVELGQYAEAEKALEEIQARGRRARARPGAARPRRPLPAQAARSTRRSRPTARSPRTRRPTCRATTRC